jgi:hypothetical protein
LFESRRSSYVKTRRPENPDSRSCHVPQDTLSQAELEASFRIEMTREQVATYRADVIRKRQQQQMKATKPAAKKPKKKWFPDLNRAGVSASARPISTAGSLQAAEHLLDVARLQRHPT